MEADYGPTGPLASGRNRKARLVRVEVADRNLPQDTKIRVQGGGVKATNCRQTGKSDFHILPPQLAELLADDDRPLHRERAAKGWPYQR